VTGEAEPASYFERIDEHRYHPTVHTGGGWDPGELHFSPLGGLMVHAIERKLGDRDSAMLMSRISFDILGRLPADDCEVRVEVIRPGRTIELVEATLSIAGRAVLRARAWLLAAIDTSSVAGGPSAALIPPGGLARWDMAAEWPGGFVASLEVRPVLEARPGRATSWITTSTSLVAGEKASELASYVALVDVANGIAVRESATEWMFPNVDLTLHLHRQPEGRWVGMDTSVDFGPTGQGVTSTILHDLAGPIGHVEQLLTVRPQPQK
jgi:hypothetical protein